jgi:tetratricopeptide (TPR) repeat protein
MSFRRLALAAGLAGLLVATTGTPSAAQKNCQGSKPRGGRWATSAELYLQKARNPQSPRDRRKRYQEALEVAMEGWAKQPDNPRNYELAGQAYTGLGDYVGADSAFRKAVELWPCYEPRIDTLRYSAWAQAFNTGVRYTQAGETEQAVKFYQDAWTVYKKLPQPMLQLGSIYARKALQAEIEEERLHAQDEAIKAFRKALDVLEQGDGRLTDAQRLEFGRAASFNLAQLLALQGRYEEAARAYERFLAVEPDNVDATNNVAVVLVRAADQLEDQAAEMEEGPEKEAILAKADSLEGAANEYFARLLARDDLDAQDYHNAGLGLMTTRRYEDAAEAFNKALDLEPFRVNSLEQLGRAYLWGEKWDTLAVVAQTLVERYPLSLDNLALLANAYRELGRVDEALEVLKRREALEAELLNLQLQAQEGVFTVKGKIHNIKAEPGSTLDLVFDFYDDAGEVVGTETVSLTVPGQDEEAEFTVTTESAALISGFAYRRAEEAATQAGN